MNYQSETKDELIKELQELQMKYDSLKTSYKKDIAQSKQAEEALKFTRLILDNAADTMAIIDYDGRFIDVNNTFCRSVGYSREQLLSMTVHDIDPLFPAATWLVFWEKLKQAGSLTFESIHRTKEGKLIPVEINVNFFEYKGKEYHCGFARDITERKELVESLHMERDNFRHTLDDSPLGVRIATKEGNTIYANKTLLNFYGYDSLEELQKTSLKDRYTQESYAQAQQRKHQREHGDLSVTDYEISIIRKNGEIRHLQVYRKEVLWDGVRQFQVICNDITERKLTEETLQFSHRLLRIANQHVAMNPMLKEFVVEVQNFTGCAAVGLRILDEEGNIPYEAYTGFSRSFYESESPLSIKSDQCMCINVIKGVTDPRYSFNTKGGSFFMNGTTRFLTTVSEEEKGRTRNMCNLVGYESVGLIPIHAEGRIIGLIHVADPRENMVPLKVVEVLEREAMQLGAAIQRMRVEEIIKAGEEKYKIIFDESPIGVALSTVKGKIIEINKAQAEIIGCTVEELTGRSVNDYYVFPDKRREIIELFKKSGKVRDYEIELKKQDGSNIIELLNLDQIQIGDKDYIFATGRDITERKLAEAELRKSEQKVFETLEFNRKILDTSSIGILTYRKSGQCVTANAAAAKAVGATIPKLLAQNFHEIPSWKKSGMYQAAIKALNTGIEQLSDVHLVTTFGKDVWLSFSFSSFDSIDEQHLLVFASDINERKLAEEEIRKSAKLLEDLHKHLDEIRENERALISREIHDQIGQSLTALKLDMNWMDKYINTNPEAVAKLRDMIGLVTGTIKDVQRISSELRPGILDDLGLAAAIEWYCDEFEKRTGIRCSLKLDDSIFGDPRKNLVFFRVLQEALTNVIRHANASSVTINLHHTQKGTTLAIQDNGIGIIGEKVISTKSLGLVGMRERVRQFGGKVNISSEKGQGTKLIIFIPEKKISKS